MHGAAHQLSASAYFCSSVIPRLPAGSTSFVGQHRANGNKLVDCKAEPCHDGMSSWFRTPWRFATQAFSGVRNREAVPVKRVLFVCSQNRLRKSHGRAGLFAALRHCRPIRRNEQRCGQSTHAGAGRVGRHHLRHGKKPSQQAAAAVSACLADRARRVSGHPTITGSWTRRWSACSRPRSRVTCHCLDHRASRSAVTNV